MLLLMGRFLVRLEVLSEVMLEDLLILRGLPCPLHDVIGILLLRLG